MAKKQIKCWECDCNKCGHHWVSKTEEEPLICPKCKTATWDREQTLANVLVASEIKESKIDKDARQTIEHLKKLQFEDETNETDFIEPEVVDIENEIA